MAVSLIEIAIFYDKISKFILILYKFYSIIVLGK